MPSLSMSRPSIAAVAVLFLVAGCGGGAAAATPTPPPPTVAPTQAATTAPATAAPTATSAATGPASLDAVQAIEAGKTLEVSWTGPNAQGDYVTIVIAGAAKWTNEDYFYTANGTPGTLVAPSKDGAYELWYVSGADEAILVRRAISITPFQGSLLGPEEIVAGTTFEVAWNGPDGPGDYVTIVKLGATKWTNEDYFYTANGTPGTLQAPIDAGAYELWYVIGSDATVQARRAITVTPYSASVEGPKSAAKGASIVVAWTGPDGPGDYITIAAAGAPEGSYLSYAYTHSGTPVTLTAPADAGAYEIRYVTQAGKTLASAPLTVN